MSGLRPPPSFARSSPTRQGYCGVGLCSASSRTSARRTWTPTSRGRSFATLATPPMHWGCSHSVTRWTTPRTTARSGSCRRRCARRSTPTSTCRTAGLEPPASGRRERRSATSLSSTDISKRTTARRCSCAQSRSASRKAMGSEPLSRGWCVHMRACAPIVRAPARPLPSPCARRGAARLTAKRALSRRILHGRAAARHVHLGHQEKLAAAHSQTHRECARRIAGRGDRPRHAPSPDGSGVARGDGCAY
mmetsp:Transcript_43294/g.106926  ORF Transcript_43294/g.106926 Transcript_43294/m.106926 type:complete len:249 (-) Transcript_43294:1173-1919(-)